MTDDSQLSVTAVEGPGATYAAAGVDIEAGDRAVELIKGRLRSTRPEVVGGLGGFAGLFRIDESRLLATSTDGVGTKVAIAQAMDKHDTIGIDLVGMVVDDIVVCGAEPLFMTDVAGAATGIVDADKVLGPERVRAGDVVVAMASSGLHSNGYSLARHVLLKAARLALDSTADLGEPLGEVLLTPTRIYTKDCLALAAALDVHALAHVTGGGLTANLTRVLPDGLTASIDTSSWEPAPVFRLIAERGQVSPEEMERTFNMGVGMVAVVPPDAADAAVALLQQRDVAAWVLGDVREAGQSRAGQKP